ncbi:phage tail protein [Salipaludibacillus sp. LMS25]|uniref:phage tail spike protein n=1 Tax=Salipaludibacillus sp. LMS25 TaxID=2924031 RepID=UPI0020D1DD0B|nr:phage tail spike protein [Salipaludibacillus sp. LMS25]UTR14091.1 phage tail protein [Salipaludibacillus sp. LMS25]
MSQIHITNGQTDQIVGLITAEHILSNNHYKSIKDTLETFQFETLADMPFSEHLGKLNRVIIPDEEQNFIEFVILETGRYRDGEGVLRIEIYTSASYQLLKKSKVIDPQVLSEYTPSTAASFALSATEWEPAIIEGEGFRTFDIEEHTNPYSLLKRIATEFDLELRFRVETNGYKVTGRYVDLLERVGQWRGREVEFGRDLIGIKRTEKTDDIVTALVGVGPAKENGTRLRVLVEDDEALQRWGRKNPLTGEVQHLIEVYEPQSTGDNMTEDELLQDSRVELNRRISEVVEYEVDIADLENVPGMENKKIRFGDTIKIKDTKFNPPLYLEARVHTQERDIADKMKKSIELGNFIEYTEDEVRFIWKQLQQEIRTRVSIAKLQEYAEPKRHEGPEPPEQRENAIWVDTSQTPYVPKVYNFGEWQQLAPTEAYQVNAYSQSETDDIARDASRIETGIIDVGAVPLRTSVTGARIEWDGLNGFVQYDIDGNPVSWLDLEGNAHFENGYFSGEISNDTVLIDHDGVTVDDGNFYLRDANSDVAYSIISRHNLVSDHSFEGVERTGSVSSDSSYQAISPSSSLRWGTVGSPRLTTVWPDGDASNILYGYQGALVNSSNYLRQNVGSIVKPGTTYTLSAYFYMTGRSSSATPRLRAVLSAMPGWGGPEQTWNQTFPVINSSTSVSNPVRRSITFTIPNNADFSKGLNILYIDAIGGGNGWIGIDGIQLVEGTTPTLYDPEDTVFVSQGDPNQRTPFPKGIYLPNASGANNSIDMSSGNYISVLDGKLSLQMWGNRGSDGIQIRMSGSSTGTPMQWTTGGLTLMSRNLIPTFSGTANVRLSTGDSAGEARLGLLSSRRELKQDISDLEITDKQLMTLKPIRFRDKLEYQERGDDAFHYLGLIAEDVAESDIIELADFDGEGNPFSVNYDRLGVALLPVVQRLIKRIEDLEHKLKEKEVE